ncbi:MAG: threonine--tRNA ligase [Candidatus Babeliales bacterium]
MGRQLGLFSFHDEAPGAPFFHPRGAKVYNRMIDYSRHMQQHDYQEIKTPLILNESLWKRTGHYDNFRDNMFFTSTEKVNYCVRPMNCPGAALLYGEQPHSYKELPMRLSEYGLDHRCELSGVLHGLFRVRAFTQDDAHIFCTPAQIADEIKNIIKLALVVYKKFGFEKVLFALSTRPEKSIGSDAQWQAAEKDLHDVLTSMGLVYKLQPREGAFYGPKIEMKIEDAMGREWQCGTAQIDFNLPERFELEYVDADQSRKRPVIVHRVIFGSVERFFGIVLESVKGHLPFWVAPIQMRILTITDDQQEYATTLLGNLNKSGYRVEVDKSGDQISAKIRRAQVEKIPWMLVLGKKEQENQTITLRTVDGKQQFGLTLEVLLEMAQKINSFE